MGKVSGEGQKGRHTDAARYLVMRWIGERIEFVDKIMREREK